MTINYFQYGMNDGDVNFDVGSSDTSEPVRPVKPVSPYTTLYTHRFIS